MLGITPFESVIVFFFSSLILALPEGLCTSPPHLSPHEKYLKKRISAPPWHVYPFPCTVPPIPAHSFDIKKMLGITPFKSVVGFFFSSLILALPKGLCTSPPHLSTHEKYLKKRISAPPPGSLFRQGTFRTFKPNFHH
jgi:hypothetical protein